MAERVPGSGPQESRSRLATTARPLSATADGSTGAGRAPAPPRYAWIAAAAERPSAIAHTISDAPRCMSPATKTPGASVCQSGAAVDAAAAVAGQAELVEQRPGLGAVEADRQQHQVGRELPLGAGHAR